MAYFRRDHQSRSNQIGGIQPGRDIEEEQGGRLGSIFRRESGDDQIERQTQRYPLGGYGGDYEDDAYRGYRVLPSDRVRDDGRGPTREDAFDRDARTYPGYPASSQWDDPLRATAGSGEGAGAREYSARWSTESADYGLGQRGSSVLHRQVRGPKNYQRSDERVREDICERLMACAGDIELSDVSVDVKDKHVTLEGSVPERWMKHAIEDLADDCLGVQDVDNRIRVSRP